MRVIKAIPSLKQQADSQWRAADKWSREFMRELARVGYDGWDLPADAPHPGTQHADGDEPGRVYFTGVGAQALTLVVRVEPGTGKVLRVACGRESMTARQATLWLHPKAPRADRRQYL
jgi:hypothetical protein